MYMYDNIFQITSSLPHILLHMLYFLFLSSILPSIDAYDDFFDNSNVTPGHIQNSYAIFNCVAMRLASNAK